MTNSTPPDRLHALSGEPEWSLLDRYFGSECTPEEANAVERWIAADDSHAELIVFLRRIWEEGGVVRPVIDEEARWHALRARVRGARSDLTPARTLRFAPLTIARRPRGGLRIARLLVAAAMAAAVAVAVLWGMGRMGHAPNDTAHAGHEYATERGQRATIMLVDGTRVWLSVDSKLRIAPGYGSSTRDVELEGEALFDVKHDAKLPFRVHTHGAVAEDLGTEFSVRAYPSDPATVVVVAEGVVALHHTDQLRVTDSSDGGVELTRGQMGRLGPSGRVTVVADVDLRTSLGWREGMLEFQELPLGDAIRELERWYDVDIALGDSSLARVPLTATLDDQTVDEAFAVIAGALDAEYRRDGRKVELVTRPRRR